MSDIHEDLINAVAYMRATRSDGMAGLISRAAAEIERLRGHMRDAVDDLTCYSEKPLEWYVERTNEVATYLHEAVEKSHEPTH